MTKKFNKILSLFILLLTLISSEGYTQYVLAGIVRDSASLSGVPYRSVTITKANSSYSKTILTDVSGFFYDTVNVVTGQNKTFFASTLDCNQNTVSDSLVTFTPGIAVLDICTGGAKLCVANFTHHNSFGNYKKVHFSNLSSLSADKYFWSFGDGDTSSQMNPIHSYSTAGYYPVCLNIVDTNSLCTDTYCDTVIVSSSNSCHNSFSYQTTGLNVNFQGGVNNNYSTIYEWSFGDGSPLLYGQQPFHSYSYGGTFQVCLTTKSIHPQNFDTCFDQSCQMITVVGQPRVNIWGQVFQGINPADKGVVFLYEKNPSSGFYTKIDSTDIESIDSLSISYYYFESIPYGTYLTKAALSPTSSYYSQFAPSYYGNTIHWDQGQPFSIQSSGYNFPINLKEVEVKYGLASVGGKVMEGTVKAPGDPVPNVPLYLVNGDDELIGFTHSSVTGEYSFGDLPYHKYYVYADLINYEIYPSITIANEGDKFKDNIDIYIGQGRVTGIDESKDIFSNIKTYPNPATEIIQLDMTLKNGALLTVSIYDMMGREVARPFIGKYFSEGNQKEVINIQDLPNGIYNLTIEGDNSTKKTLRIVIIR